MCRARVSLCPDLLLDIYLDPDIANLEAIFPCRRRRFHHYHQLTVATATAICLRHRSAAIHGILQIITIQKYQREITFTETSQNNNF